MCFFPKVDKKRQKQNRNQKEEKLHFKSSGD